MQESSRRYKCLKCSLGPAWSRKLIFFVQVYISWPHLLSCWCYGAPHNLLSGLIIPGFSCSWAGGDFDWHHWATLHYWDWTGPESSMLLCISQLWLSVKSKIAPAWSKIDVCPTSKEPPVLQFRSQLNLPLIRLPTPCPFFTYTGGVVTHQFLVASGYIYCTFSK